MRINQNAYYSDHLRILGQNRKKSMEKLSSGLAINRASDNAAGLSIGIKMNAQVRGISQARRNIMDSQGLLEVAERGLQGVNSSLHRMRELSVQAANGVLTDSDRKEIQSEMDSLKKVISSTVKDTNFNTQMVLATEKPQVIHEVPRIKDEELGIIKTEELYSQQYNEIIPNQKSLSFSQTISSVFKLNTIDINSLESVSTLSDSSKIIFEPAEITINAISESINGISETGELSFATTRSTGDFYVDSGTLKELEDSSNKIITSFDYAQTVTHNLDFQLGISSGDSNTLLLEVRSGDGVKTFNFDDAVTEKGFSIEKIPDEDKVVINYFTKEELVDELTGVVTFEYYENSEGISWKVIGEEIQFSNEEYATGNSLLLTSDPKSLSLQDQISYEINDTLSVSIKNENTLFLELKAPNESIEILNADVSKGYTLSDDGKTIYYASSTDGRIKSRELEAILSSNIDESFNVINISQIVLKEEKQFIIGQEWIDLPEDLPLYKLEGDSPSIRVYNNSDPDHSLNYNGVNGFTIIDERIYFHGTAVSNDGYKVDYVKSNMFNLPLDMDIYKIGNENSIKITIKNEVIDDLDVFFNMDSIVDKKDYLLIMNNVMELHGDFRLGLDDDPISVNYVKTGANTFKIDDYIDYYDLDQKAIKVSVNNYEIPQISEGNINYTYDSSNGTITLHGNHRILFDSLTEETPSFNDVKIEYYEGTDEDSDSTKIYFKNTNLPEIYRLTDNQNASIIVKRHEIDESGKITGTDGIGYSTENGFSYSIGDKFIKLHGNARPDTDDGISDYKYEISYAYELYGSTKQDGIYEIQLSNEAGKYMEFYTDRTVPDSIKVKSGSTFLAYLSVVNEDSNGWYYDKEDKKIVLVGDARPSASETITVEYLLGNSSDVNDSYDFIIKEEPKDYGLDLVDYPQSIKVYIDGNEINYSSDKSDGYSVDVNKRMISLHGNARPMVGLSPNIEVFYVKDDFQVKIHEPNEEEHEINRVFMGKEYADAVEIKPGGYTYKDGVITIVGDARPDVSKEIGRDINVYVKHSPPKYVEIDESSMIYDPYLEKWRESTEHKADIPMDRMKITIMPKGEDSNGKQTVSLDTKYFDGVYLKPEYFYLEEGKVRFSDELEFTEGNHDVRINYVAIHAREYEDNEFTFQVGPNSGNDMKVSISSMENMLFTTDQLKVTSREYADKTIGIVDKLISQVSSEMGSLGAMQNRLTSASNNLAVLEENTTSAMSRIMDVDYAKEMLNQIKYSILEQAVTALQVHQMSASQNILKLIS